MSNSLDLVVLFSGVRSTDDQIPSKLARVNIAASGELIVSCFHDATHPDARGESEFLADFSRRLEHLGIAHEIHKRKVRDVSGRPATTIALSPYEIDTIRVPLAIGEPALDPR